MQTTASPKDFSVQGKDSLTIDFRPFFLNEDRIAIFFADSYFVADNSLKAGSKAYTQPDDDARSLGDYLISNGLGYEISDGVIEMVFNHDVAVVGLNQQQEVTNDLFAASFF